MAVGKATDVAVGAGNAVAPEGAAGNVATTAAGTVNCENAARVARLIPDPVGRLTLPKLPLVEP